MNNQKLDFVLAFPGIGKTAALNALTGLEVLEHESVAKMRSNRCQPMELYARLIRGLAMDGATVLIDEPKVLPYLKQKRQRGIVIVPAHPDAFAINAAGRVEAVGGPGSLEHSKALLRDYAPWVRSWIRAAEKYGYPVARAEFLKEDLHMEGGNDTKGKAEDR